MRKSIAILGLLVGFTACIFGQTTKQSTEKTPENAEKAKQVTKGEAAEAQEAKTIEIKSAEPQTMRKKQDFTTHQNKDPKAKKTRAELQAEGVKRLQQRQARKAQSAATPSKETAAPAKKEQ